VESGGIDQRSGQIETESGPASLDPEAPKESGEQPRAPEANAAGQPGSEAKRSRRSGFARIVDWFWDGPRMRELRETARREGAVVELDRRARLTLEVARRVLDPDDAFVEGRADAIACELNRQACHWAARAIVARRKLGEQPSASASGTAVGDPLALLEVLDAPLVERLLPDGAEREQLRTDLARDFTAFADLSVEEQGRAARRLGTFAAKLLDGSQTVQHAIEALWIRRLLRLGLVVLVLALIGGVGILVRDRAEASRDLAAGKPWRTSSTYPIAACKSPLQECDESPHFFFHTNEERKPWLELDLGSVQRVGGIRIENRSDCCRERAVPLVVETSTDQQKWQGVARHDEKFKTWRATFEPVDARWVRVRVDGKSMLHLKSVRVLPP